MLGTYVQPGDTLNYVNPTENDIEAGTLVVYGSKIGIAATNIPAGGLGTIAMSDSWSLPKDSSEIGAGAAVYYNSGADKVTATAAEGSPYVGFAIAAAKAADTTVTVKLNV
ncbi:MAG: DUF2190 family protein [bacterium]|nr:DUF2190 family protein [bacterium]